MGIETAIVAAAAVGAATSAYQGRQQGKEAKAASQRAADAARAQATAADREFNRQNMKRPDVGALLSSNTLAAQGGNQGTMLTGPMGVDPGMLQLQRNTLLGE